MKTFDDLIFEPHPHAVALKQIYSSNPNISPYIEEMLDATQARMDFPNGYGISVLCGNQFYSNGRNTYEVGVMYQGRLIRYFPNDSVIGWQTKEEVSELIKEVQKLEE